MAIAAIDVGYDLARDSLLIALTVFVIRDKQGGSR
jgi:hypothetical protein